MISLLSPSGPYGGHGILVCNLTGAFWVTILGVRDLVAFGL
jgi:hypothetical protein